MLPQRKCFECGDPLHGRADQKFCSDQCRNAYNNNKLGQTNNANRRVNRILKKNQTLLSGLNKSGKITIPRSELIGKEFNFNYFTSMSTTQQGRVYFFCYDQGYSIVSGDKVLLVRKPEYACGSA